MALCRGADTVGLIIAGSCTGDALRDEGAMVSSELGRDRVTSGVRRDHFGAQIVAGWRRGALQGLPHLCRFPQRRDRSGSVDHLGEK